ncbi:MAG: NnrS family protein [Opitutaceae bacterium]
MPRSVAIREPYRLFFPAGLFAGLLGVALWPAWVWGGMALYPGPLHARLMSMGLLGAFVVGFSATALPRMMGTGPLGGGVVVGLGLLWSGAVGAQIVGVAWLGDLLFGLTLLLLILSLLARFIRRLDLPPPAFVLTAFGLVLGLTGAVALAWAEYPVGTLPSADWIYRWGRVALHEGFLLGVAGGVGAFFFPRLWGGRTRQDFPEMKRPDARWASQGWVAFWAGMGLTAGCGLDAAGFVRAGTLLRLTSFGFFVISEVAATLGLRSESTLGGLARIGLFLIPVGLLLEIVVLPGQLTGIRHLIMIGGFNLILFAVATRVIFGHAGERDRTTGRMISMRWVGGLLMVAALTRVSADFLPSVYQSHLGYAAVFWLSAALIWSGLIFQRISRADPED